MRVVPRWSSVVAANSGRPHLEPVMYDSRLSAVVQVKDAMIVKGPPAGQGVALAGKSSGSNDLDSDFSPN